MPNNATVHSVALKIESVYPGIRVDYQPFVPSVIEVISEESSKGMLRQLILTILVEQMMSALCDHQLRLWFLIPIILNMMDAEPFQKGIDLADRQLKVTNVSCHIITIVLVEHCQLEMQMVCLTCDLDIAANVSVKHRAGILIVHQCGKILLTQKKTGRSAVIDVECGQGNEVRLGRDEFNKRAFCEVCHGDDLLSNIPIAKKKAPRTEIAKPQKELQIS
jgi:hypothetical protein